MSHAVASGFRSAGDDVPLLLRGGQFGLQVWACGLDTVIWATLMIEAETRVGPIMLLNRLLAGTADEGAALNWALALLVDCAPGFYVLRACA